MKMKSLKAQFIGAIAMVLVAAIAMGSSTYAWFASNTNAKATDMQVGVKSNSTYLLINTGENDSAAEIQSAGVSTIQLTVSPGSEYVYPSSPALNATHTGYLTVAEGHNTTAGAAITTAGVAVTSNTTAAAVTNWFTANATAVSASAINADTAKQLRTEDFGDYVIKRTAYLTLAVGSDNANNLKVTGHIEPRGITATSDTTVAAGAYYYSYAAGVYTNLNLAEDATVPSNSYKSTTVNASKVDISGVKVLVATDDGGFTILDYASSANVDIKGTNTALTPTSVRTVDIYIYYDGEETAVFTNNKANLGAAMISLDFDVDVVTA